jgi:RNA polymerase sigma-70 factor, ECF subfamily
MFVLHQVSTCPTLRSRRPSGSPPPRCGRSHCGHEYVPARRPRVHVNQSEQQPVVERFLTALRIGQLQELMDILGPDVGLIADGAESPPLGFRSTRPTQSQPACARHRVLAAFETTTVWLNGAGRHRWPAGRSEPGGGEWPCHADLRLGQPTQADASQSTGRTRQVSTPEA